MIGSRKAIGLIVLAGLALGLRIWVVSALHVQQAGPVVCPCGRIAENLLAGRGFCGEFLGPEGPTSQQAPFYPLLLAAAWSCFGSGTPEAILAIQLLQCVAGTLLALAVAWVGWSLVSNRPSIGWSAALAAAVYPPHVFMVADLQASLWAALVLTLLLAIVISPRWRATRGGAVLAGLLAGLLLLIEPILALALPICAIAFWTAEAACGWRNCFSRAAIGRLALMAALTTLTIAPWTIRNWIVHGRPVPIKSTFGYAFWQGNNPLSWGTARVPKPAADPLQDPRGGTPTETDCLASQTQAETVLVDDVALKPSDYDELTGFSEPQRSDLLGRRAWQFVRSHPAQYARLCLRRLRYFLLFDETDPQAAGRLYRIATVAWLVLAAIGLSISRGHWRRLWPTYAIFAALGAFHSLVIVSARCRVPVEPMTLVWTAAALAPLLVRLLPGRRIRIYRPGEHPRDPLASEHVLQGPHYEIPLRRRAG